MPTNASRSYGREHAPFEFPKDALPAIPGVEVIEIYGPRAWASAVRMADFHDRLRATQALMKARK